MKGYDSQYHFAKQVLGPIFHDYLFRLDGHLRHFQCEHRAKALFVSRAGVRIRKLYETYLAAVDKQLCPDIDYFWISRIMCTKGIWNTNCSLAAKVLQNEFSNSSLRELVAAMFRSKGIPEDLDLDEPVLDNPASLFSDFIWGQTHSAHLLRWHLSEQSTFFEMYLRDLTTSHDRLVMIDTGWQGTTHTLLAEWRPDIDWWSLLFGRSGSLSTDRSHWDQMIGLMFESDEFELSNPASSVILHRHLIEDLLEPKGMSIEHLALDEHTSRVFAPGAATLVADQPTAATSPMFIGVQDYLKEISPNQGVSEILASAQSAWQVLKETLAFPTRSQAKILGVANRSADFGRDILVPVILDPVDRHVGDSAERRIQQSLWQCAQIAIEYPSELALKRQNQFVSTATTQGLQNQAHVHQTASATSHRPTVAIITRTMDRLLLLERALLSVARQTFTSYVHVIICDGAPTYPIIDLIERSGCDRTKTILIDNVSNRGMEAASNIGIDNSFSDYIVIHDDDDSWEPSFLQVMVAFLERKENRMYGGAISHCLYVSETVGAFGIKINEKRPYNNWVTNIPLMEMACENFFAPIAFLFRRSMRDIVGPFDEALPVLGDWDFNLRFLMRADIAVVGEMLANYHHRDSGEWTFYSNSVTGGVSKHAQFHAVVRNKFLRSLEVGHQTLGTLISVGMSLLDMRGTVRRVAASSEEILRTSQSNSSTHRAMEIGLSGSGIDEQERKTLASDRIWMALFASILERAELQSRVDEATRQLQTLQDAGFLTSLEATRSEQQADQRLQDNFDVGSTIHHREEGYRQLQHLADRRWMALCLLEAMFEEH